MQLMRPAQMSDLPQVQRLAADSPVGVTSLPDDTASLREKIRASEASFAADVCFNGEESYFFVIEDSTTGELLGCSGLVASAGYSEPFYSFRNETFVHASRSLKVHNKTHVLSLCHDLTGTSLLVSFYVRRELIETPTAELTSRGRLLFVASHPERFADELVTEIVGYSDEQGNSPFWDGVGRHFLGLSYAEVERLCGLKSRAFVAELMPHYPIYVPLLDDAAQETMGQIYDRSQVTFDILTREGFEADHYIDIFDGGPTLHGQVSSIHSIAHSQHLELAGIAPQEVAQLEYLICNGRLQDFRALVAQLCWQPGQPLYLSDEQASALKVKPGDYLRLIAL